MSKNTTPKASVEVQLLGLLKQVLPKATHDPKLAGKIYDAIEQELKLKARAVAFEKFCARVELPDLEPKSVADVQRQLAVLADLFQPRIIEAANRHNNEAKLVGAAQR